MSNLLSSVFLLIFFFEFGTSQRWEVLFNQSRLEMKMKETISIPLKIIGPKGSKPTLNYNTDKKIVDVTPAVIAEQNDGLWSGHVNITSIFIGSANVTIAVSGSEAAGILTVVVKRQERIIDTVFTASVAILCTILYINFGCAMDWTVCHQTLKRPIGPFIGLICQFVFMPLASFVIGYFLFPDSPEMRLGIFFTGISPSGGASNIWTMLLDGNLNLSIAMTTIGTFVAIGMIPFWLFTLGKLIFELAKMTVPYRRIFVMAFGLLIPLALGYLIQKKCPRLSRLMVRVMKPFAVVLVVFIVVFAIIANSYLFSLFSWRIAVAGISLPWLGFIFGYIVALICKQSTPDIRAIAIETGVQNTGIAIFLLRFGLPQPAADLTTVVPVSVAIMTPLPLTILYIIKLCFDRSTKRKTSTEKLESTEPSMIGITQDNIYTTLDQ